MTDTRPALYVADVFGPTFQGEGPYLGRRCGFVRLGGCNLTCRACDTPSTWDARRHNLRETITSRAVDGVVADLAAMRPLNMVVITGGEPLIHQRHQAFRYLLETLVDVDVLVQFETNGTIRPADWLAEFRGVAYVVSPKLVGGLATDDSDRRIRPDVLAWFAHNPRAHFKIVCQGSRDVHDVAHLAEIYGIPPGRVWIMPEGTDPALIADTARDLADTVLARGFNITTRFHRELWPTEETGR